MKSKLPLFGTVFCLLIALESFCQDDYARWDSLFKRGIGFSDVDNEKALHYADSSKILACQLGDSLRIVKSHRFRGQILRRLDNTNEAVKEFQEAVAIATRNGFDKENGFALNGLAIAYTLQANYDKALQRHFECLILRERDGDVEGICTTLNNIGLVYYKLGNYEMALEYYTKTLARSENISLRYHLLGNIGLCYNYLNDFNAAIKFITEGLKICNSNCDELATINGELGLGIAHFNLGRLDQAESHFLTSLKLARVQKDKRFQIENLIYLGRIKNNQRRYGIAKGFLSEAESVASRTYYNELLINVYKQLAESFNRTGDYKRAAFYQEKYISLGDSVHNEQLMKNLMSIHADYEELENKAKITSQNQVLKLKENVIQQQRYLNILIGVIAILLVGLAIVLFKTNRNKQRINVLLDRKVQERTKALELSISGLQRAQLEQETFINRASRDLKSSIATMEGLRRVASLDPETPEIHLRYFKAFDSTIEGLTSLAGRLRVSARAGKVP